MIEDMFKITLAVEGMKAQIVNCFDAKNISGAIRNAADKAVAEFDMEAYIADTVETVFYDAKEVAVEVLAKKYGGRWADYITEMVDAKVAQALGEIIDEEKHDDQNQV